MSRYSMEGYSMVWTLGGKLVPDIIKSVCLG